MEIHMKDKKVRSEATQRQKLFSTLKTTKGRKIQKVKRSIMKSCTDHHLIKQTIQNALSLKTNTLLEYSRVVRGNKHVQTRRYTCANKKIYSCPRRRGSTAFREDTEQKDKTLPAHITSNKPGTSVSPAQPSPRVAGSHRKTKVYSQTMRKYFHH